MRYRWGWSDVLLGKRTEKCSSDVSVSLCWRYWDGATHF